MKKSFFVFVFCILYAVFALSSCSTTLRMRVTRPAELDLGASTIAVLPFSESIHFPFYSNFNNGREIASESYFNSYGRVNGVERQVLNYLHSEIEKGLMSSQYVSLISNVAVTNALRGNGKNPADVYITGEMVTFHIFDEKKMVKRQATQEDLDKEAANNEKFLKSVSVPESVEIKEVEYVYDTYYTREVLVVFNYEIVDGASNKILYYDTLKIDNKSDIVEELKALPSPYSMIEYELRAFVSDFLRKLQPYSFDKSVTLLEDKTKNPDMKYADQLAKDGYLRESYNAFLNVYDSIGQFEAGYNAAMILMVLGEFESAESLMEDVYAKTGNYKASQGLTDIRNEIRQADILKKQTDSSVLDK